MGGLGGYILSVGAAALITGILNGMTDPRSTSGVLTKMACGLFLMIVMIKPVVGLELEDLADLAEPYAEASAASVDYGEELAGEALRERIRQQTQAYILDKAGSYGAELEVSVTVADGQMPVPESVMLKGDISPYAKTMLQEMMISDLGIPKERQKWIR